MNLATVTQVIGNFFPAMGIPLLRGRFFTEADRHGSQLVVIVNHKLAQHFWPGQDPIGKRLRIGTPEMQTPWLTVVGEVADVKLTSPDEPAKEQYYVPVDQAEDDIGTLANPRDRPQRQRRIYRAALRLPPEQMENALRATVRSIDPQLPLDPGADHGAGRLAKRGPRRFNTVLIGSFAFAAVLLAVLGIYSVISFTVASRVQEMAIRMALGSQRGASCGWFCGQAPSWRSIGCVLGLAGAAAASRLMRSLLFGVSPFDPLMLTVAARGSLAAGDRSFRTPCIASGFD